MAFPIGNHFGVGNGFKKGNSFAFKKGNTIGSITRFKTKEEHRRWTGGSRKYYHDIAVSVMEKHIGRKLVSEETIHHLDYDYTNNNIENLYLFDSRKEHTTYHNMLRRFVAEESNLKMKGFVVEV